jgi:hypothetical protein
LRINPKNQNFNQIGALRAPIPRNPPRMTKTKFKTKVEGRRRPKWNLPQKWKKSANH